MPVPDDGGGAGEASGGGVRVEGRERPGGGGGAADGGAEDERGELTPGLRVERPLEEDALMAIMSARKSDTGGSRRSYRNGRVLLCRGREHPLPEGALITN